jgi:hypothetical protein
MTHFVHIADEMGRNPITRLAEASEVRGNFLGSNLESPLFHEEPAARLAARISHKHVSDGIGVHCFFISFGDMADDVLHCHWVVIGMSFGKARDKIIMSSRINAGGGPFARCFVA